MSSDEKPNSDQNTENRAATLIPVQVEHVDQLVLLARDLAGFVLILDAAAIGDPTIAAVERIVSEFNDRLQEFKSWFHNAWHEATAASSSGPASHDGV
jgi:DNA-binding GntR family transcriptional regulator